MIHEMDYCRITELQSKARRRVTWIQFFAWFRKPAVATACVIAVGVFAGLVLTRIF